jgi:hypothetical protein
MIALGVITRRADRDFCKSIAQLAMLQTLNRIGQCAPKLLCSF